MSCSAVTAALAGMSGWMTARRCTVAKRSCASRAWISRCEIYTFTKEINGRTSVDYERVSIPGNAGMAVIANDDFVNDDERFVCAEKVVPQLVTIRVDGSYSHEESQLHLDTVIPGMDPIDVRYERESDVGWGNSFFFVERLGDFATSGASAGVAAGNWRRRRRSIPHGDGRLRQSVAAARC